VPEAGQVAREAAERAALLGGERRRPRLLERGKLAALALDVGERLLEPLLERAGDQAVLGLAGVELAARPLGLELGPLEREPLAVRALFVLALELLDRPRRGARRIWEAGGMVSRSPLTGLRCRRGFGRMTQRFPFFLPRCPPRGDAAADLAGRSAPATRRD
jgi:hypothetical protein